MDFLESEIVEILNIFREESEEQLQKLNKNLLKLETNPKDDTAISELFREAHSLKGSARMIGLNDIQLIAHKLEDVFGMAKERSIGVTPETIDILCKAVDCISSIINESIKTRGKSTFEQVPAMIQKLESIINSENLENSEINNQNLNKFDINKISKENKKLIIQIKVNIEKIKIFSSNSDAIEELLHFVKLLESAIEVLNNAALTEIITNIKAKIQAALKDSGILNSNEIWDIEENFEIFSSLFERLKDNSNIQQEPDKERLFLQKLSSANTGAKILSKNVSLSENDYSCEIKPGDNNTIKTLRVDTKKLDQLVSQVGELIISKIKAKEHLSELKKMIQSVEEWNRTWNKTKKYLNHADKPYKSADAPSGLSLYNQTKNINNFLEENSAKFAGLMNNMNYLYKIIQEDDARLNLIVNELEERIKNVRVLPLATIFHMFPRMVRDIAREKNKNIELVISGSETSVDKKIIEEIKSPLIHLIRNAIDHGIELPEIRIKKGKDPVGKILLASYHLENSVLIEIIDDGNGIDIEAIKRKVIEKHLLSKDELAAMTEEQIMNIVFWSGFSTGETITDISGRGIGLDIVYTKISQLNGKIKIKSTLGEGCRVSIQIPVTMATIKSFLIEINLQKFAIPTSTIKTTLLISPENIFCKEGVKTILVDGTTVPICNLSDVLNLPKNNKKNKKLVVIVVQSEDIQVGFIVDKLIGDQEILHKNLSPPLLRVRNIAGITTLGSGELCLILNIGDLVKTVYSKFDNILEKQKQLFSECKISTEKHILIVDDSLTTRTLEKNILKTAGYTVTMATNGLEALTKIATENFDLIISDLEMPEINGFELTEKLRKQEKFKKIPIILVTSLASEINKRRGLNLGANAYLEKGNFNQDELLTTIQQLLE